eukprot:TRINITY_DN38025_c0_g1_i2.p1 TRINITY_DN38025_c0_g1~~TRINITY_DN38025_c0_g1_i2.p1  ORF type:complete len:1491 (-),score=438.68 TRINITY_DN38025_c0_g1_i2:649-5121(-)
MYKRTVVQYLGKYIKGLNTDQVSSSLLTGDFELRDAELEVDTVNNLLAGLLPYTLKVNAAVCDLVRVQVPWSALRSKPVRVQIGRCVAKVEVHSKDDKVWATTAAEKIREATVARAANRTAREGSACPPIKLNAIKVAVIDGLEVLVSSVEVMLLSAVPAHIPPGGDDEAGMENDASKTALVPTWELLVKNVTFWPAHADGSRYVGRPGAARERGACWSALRRRLAVDSAVVRPARGRRGGVSEQTTVGGHSQPSSKTHGDAVHVENVAVDIMEWRDAEHLDAAAVAATSDASLGGAATAAGKVRIAGFPREVRIGIRLPDIDISCSEGQLTALTALAGDIAAPNLVPLECLPEEAQHLYWKDPSASAAIKAHASKLRTTPEGRGRTSSGNLLKTSPAGGTMAERASGFAHRGASVASSAAQQSASAAASGAFKTASAASALAQQGAKTAGAAQRSAAAAATGAAQRAAAAANAAAERAAAGKQLAGKTAANTAGRAAAAANAAADTAVAGKRLAERTAAAAAASVAARSSMAASAGRAAAAARSAAGFSSASGFLRGKMSFNSPKRVTAGKDQEDGDAMDAEAKLLEERAIARHQMEQQVVQMGFDPQVVARVQHVVQASSVEDLLQAVLQESAEEVPEVAADGPPADDDDDVEADGSEVRKLSFEDVADVATDGAAEAAGGVEQPSHEQELEAVAVEQAWQLASCNLQPGDASSVQGDEHERLSTGTVHLAADAGGVVLISSDALHVLPEGGTYFEATVEGVDATAGGDEGLEVGVTTTHPSALAATEDYAVLVEGSWVSSDAGTLWVDGTGLEEIYPAWQHTKPGQLVSGDVVRFSISCEGAIGIAVNGVEQASWAARLPLNKQPLYALIGLRRPCVAVRLATLQQTSSAAVEEACDGAPPLAEGDAEGAAKKEPAVALRYVPRTEAELAAAAQAEEELEAEQEDQLAQEELDAGDDAMKGLANPASDMAGSAQRQELLDAKAVTQLAWAGPPARLRRLAVHLSVSSLRIDMHLPKKLAKDGSLELCQQEQSVVFEAGPLDVTAEELRCLEDAEVVCMQALGALEPTSQQRGMQVSAGGHGCVTLGGASIKFLEEGGRTSDIFVTEVLGATGSGGAPPWLLTTRWGHSVAISKESKARAHVCVHGARSVANPNALQAVQSLVGAVSGALPQLQSSEPSMSVQDVLASLEALDLPAVELTVQCRNTVLDLGLCSPIQPLRIVVPGVFVAAATVSDETTQDSSQAAASSGTAVADVNWLPAVPRWHAQVVASSGDVATERDVTVYGCVCEDEAKSRTQPADQASAADATSAPAAPPRLTERQWREAQPSSSSSLQNLRSEVLLPADEFAVLSKAKLQVVEQTSTFEAMAMNWQQSSSRRAAREATQRIPTVRELLEDGSAGQLDAQLLALQEETCCLEDERQEENMRLRTCEREVAASVALVHSTQAAKDEDLCRQLAEERAITEALEKLVQQQAEALRALQAAAIEPT